MMQLLKDLWERLFPKPKKEIELRTDWASFVRSFKLDRMRPAQREKAKREIAAARRYFK